MSYVRLIWSPPYCGLGWGKPVLENQETFQKSRMAGSCICRAEEVMTMILLNLPALKHSRTLWGLPRTDPPTNSCTCLLNVENL